MSKIITDNFVKAITAGEDLVVLDSDNKNAKINIEIPVKSSLRYFLVLSSEQESSKEIRISLADEAHLEFKAIVLGNDVDNYELDLVMNHVGRASTANTDIRAVLAGKSKAKLVGTIRISEKGHQTQAFLEERALLLSDEARAQTIPQLEIETDDVQATHAAVVAKLSEEQLFYLQARGLSYKQARQMIIASFLLGNLESLPEGEEGDTLKANLEGKLHKILSNE